MGKPGNKNQSALSNIFRRVPNANNMSSEAIVPGIGGIGEESAEHAYMSKGQSPLQLSQAQQKLDVDGDGDIGGDDLASLRSSKKPSPTKKKHYKK
tara:strand:+ start:304 stop:591 length:288 start_codon:yes stop_codon:yes gene_type:complete